MQPTYFKEKLYSYHAFSGATAEFAPRQSFQQIDYEMADPETTFEKQVQGLFLEGNDYLQVEEYSLALNSFRELENLILTTAHPILPLDTYMKPNFMFPYDASLVDVLARRAGGLLTSTAVKRYRLPEGAVSPETLLPPEVAKKLAPYVDSGLTLSRQLGRVDAVVTQALAAARDGNWAGSHELYQTALRASSGAGDTVRGSLLHDLSIVAEKAGADTATTVKYARDSAKAFATAKVYDGQAEAMTTLSGIYTRAGDTANADKAASEAQALSDQHHLHGVTVPGDGARVSLSPAAVRPAPQPRPAATLTAGAATPTLLGDRYWAKTEAPDSFTVIGKASSLTVSLTGDVTKNLKDHLQAVSVSDDVSLLRPFAQTYEEIVAYLPGMYFFVIPMAIGDCLVGLGDYSGADAAYRGTLVYPYINRQYEAVTLWTKLASLYLTMGDSAYRQAGDSGHYGAAKAQYEKILRTDLTLDAASPLYQDSTFSSIKARVAAFVAAGFSTTTDDNPALLSKVLEAKLKLTQIESAMNFFGFTPGYNPPFSWEYLQTTAKYFAQQASTIEQRYIQYKTAAEDETLQREQLDQQAEVARQTVELEERGRDEAQAGVDVAQASLDYSQLGLDQAKAARDDFDANRSELEAYAEMEAWANASAVDHDDEVLLTLTGSGYYSSSSKPRNQVLQDLAGQRTRLTDDMEADRLQREVDAAQSYIDVSNAQLDEADARVAIADQRIAIAQLQQKDAEENRDYMDMKEFSAHLWYDLAQQARTISQKYLDMAIQIALLSERAYNAETERGLHVIRFDYSQSATDDLMGADFLLLDLDTFTLDHLTSVKTKKAPVKRVISLADTFPTAFRTLKASGRCFFQTELSLFDRMDPGMYLCKTRNVELLFVGVDTQTLAGSLRNVGVSRFREEAGTVITRHYPADVMPLSSYDLRQDALAFPANPNERRLFENNGIATLWRLDLPLSANDLEYEQILDIQLVLYYDGFFSPALESSIVAALPTTGSSTQLTSLRMSYADEFFYLKNQGEAQVVFDAALFPRNQVALVRQTLSMKFTGDPSLVQGLTFRLASKRTGTELVLATDATGSVAGAASGDPLFPLVGQPVFDTWTLRITAEDNPGHVTDGKLVLKGLHDVNVRLQYGFKYR